MSTSGSGGTDWLPPPHRITRIRQEYDRLVAAFRTDDGMLALPAAALLAGGTVR